MTLAQFDEWVRANPNVTALTEWIFRPAMPLLKTYNLPTRTETLANVSRFDSRQIGRLEERFWRVRNRTGSGFGAQLNAKGLECQLCPPLTRPLLARKSQPAASLSTQHGSP